MKVFNQQQLKEWDAYTIENEDITAIDLIREAGQSIADELEVQYLFSHDGPVRIFCGTGHNGADGLMIARTLCPFVEDLECFVIRVGKSSNEEFNVIRRELDNLELPITDITHVDEIPHLASNSIIIDAILGTGISRPVRGPIAEVIHLLNQIESYLKVSVDLPSGVHPDQILDGVYFKADITYTIGTPKLSSFYKEYSLAFGEKEILQIELSERYYQQTNASHAQIDLLECGLFTPGFDPHSYKNEFGHALFVGGMKGKMGAAVLACEAALRAGCGLVTAHVPACGTQILQTAVPEVMVEQDDQSNHLTNILLTSQYQSIIIGCGMGASVSSELLRHHLTNIKTPKVLDADALNLMSRNRELLELLHPNCVLTPHIGEFHRLFGTCEKSDERMRLACEKAREFNCHIILKGRHTLVAYPNGKCYINVSGNATLATAGSGDILAGYLGGMLARGMEVGFACQRAVLFHGLAGDVLLERNGPRGGIARDILSVLGGMETYVEGLIERLLNPQEDFDQDMEMNIYSNLN